MVACSPRMADAPAQLDYAQPLSWRHRKGVRRGIVAAMVLLGVLGSVKFSRRVASCEVTLLPGAVFGARGE